MDEYLFDNQNGYFVCTEEDDEGVMIEDAEEFVTSDLDNWETIHHTQFKTKITIDEAKTGQWEKTKRRKCSKNLTACKLSTQTEFKAKNTSHGGGYTIFNVLPSNSIQRVLFCIEILKYIMHQTEI